LFKHERSQIKGKKDALEKAQFLQNDSQEQSRGGIEKIS
jgi:hypothetical protein